MDVNKIRQHTLIDHDLSYEINESLQLPCKLLYDKDNDKEFSVVYDMVVIFDEDQEHSEHLVTVDNKEEKQLANHLNQAAIWSEVCFPITNHPEDLIWQDYHYPLVNILQSLVEEEFSKFINRAIKSGGKVKMPFSEFTFLPRKVECKLLLSIHLIDWLQWKFVIT